MGFINLQSAIYGPLQTYADTNGYIIVWEGQTFKPDLDKIYIRPFFQHARTSQAALGVTGQDKHVGLFLIHVYAPIGSGYGVSGTVIDDLLDIYPRGTLIQNGDMDGSVTSSMPGPSESDGSWFVSTMIVRYRVYSTPGT